MSDWGQGYVTDIAYAPGYFRETSPAWLTWICLLRGRRPPRLDEGFTYCDLGCGTGFGVTALAATHPQGRFWGFDFNPAHVADGRELARVAGIGNLTFGEESFADLAAGAGPDLPRMDFIVLHGVYTWVTAEHRAAIVRFIDRRLKPGGIVYVSYNCLPGWAALQPLQRLLVEVDRLAPGATAQRVEAGLAMGRRMRDAGAAFFAAHPPAGAQLDELQGHDAAYLAHEYLNEGSIALYHADVARDLAAAKLGYVGSATVGDNYDGLGLDDAQRALLAEQADPLLARTLRDYLLNTRFRRDVWQRGDVVLGGIEQRERMAALGLALTRPRATANAVFKGPRGETVGNPAVYDPVLDALADGPRRIGALLADPRLAGTTLPGVIEVGSMMMGTEQMHPVAGPGPSEASFKAARGLNMALVRAATRGKPYDLLVSPVIGAAVALDFVDTIGVSALMDPPDATPDIESLSPVVRAVMRATGRKLVVGKRVLTDDAENHAEADRRLETFLSQRLPLYRQLGIL